MMNIVSEDEKRNVTYHLTYFIFSNIFLQKKEDEFNFYWNADIHMILKRQHCSSPQPTFTRPSQRPFLPLPKSHQRSSQVITVPERDGIPITRQQNEVSNVIPAREFRGVEINVIKGPDDPNKQTNGGDGYRTETETVNHCKYIKLNIDKRSCRACVNETANK